MKKGLIILAAAMITSQFPAANVSAADTVYYLVDCGDYSPEAASGTDSLGIYQGATDQFYGKDPVTGRMWGVIGEAEYTENAITYGDSRVDTTWAWANAASVDCPKEESFRFCHDMYENGLERVITYQFELPDGTYQIETGFNDPWWCATPVSVSANGETIIDSLELGHDTSTVASATVTVSGGKLELTATTDAATICWNYIVISGQASENSEENAEAGNSHTSDNSETPAEDTTPLDETPKTGDFVQTGTWAGLCLLSIGGMAYLFSVKKHSN